MIDPEKAVPSIPDPSIIKMLPGHIIYESGEAAASASFCDHRWILDENNKVRCVLCDGVRELTQKELQVIENSKAAGVQFLRWNERFAALERLAGPKGKRARRKQTRAPRKASSKATGGVAQGTVVPEGFIDVKTAAAQLGTDPKRLRKKIRSGHYEGIKVGGRVYVKIS